MMEIIGIIIIVLLTVIMLFVSKQRSVKVDVSVPPQETKEKYVPAISQYDPKAEVTTICPVPIGSLGCSHDFETVVNETLEVDHEKKCIVILKCEKCGLIDKTIVATSTPPKVVPPPVPPVPRSECRHKWDDKKAVTLDSAYEQMSKIKVSNGQWKKDVKQPEIKPEEIEPWMFRKTYVSIRICTLCGEVDKSIVSNLTDQEEEPDES